MAPGGYGFPVNSGYPTFPKEHPRSAVHKKAGKNRERLPGTQRSGTPAEFLSLRETGASSNFSQYTVTPGSASPGSTVKTTYSKLRIDPETLRVNTADQTFTTSSGQLRHGGETVTSMPYAVAMSCDAQASGRATLDLRGLPFEVAANQFGVGGSGSSGNTSYSTDSKQVDLTGGGFC